MKKCDRHYYFFTLSPALWECCLGLSRRSSSKLSLIHIFINTGARNLLLQGERQKFLAEEWPRVHATIQRLGLRAEELLDASANGRPSNAAEEEPKS